MAAYAALVSVFNIIEQIQDDRRRSSSFDKKQLESLSENVEFLVEFLECCADGGRKEVEALESQIAYIAHAAEDVIESNVVDQIRSGSTLNGETGSCFLVDLQKVIEDIDSIKKLAMEVKAKRGFRDQMIRFSEHATSSRPLAIEKNVIMRDDDELTQLMERLTRQQPNRQIIPIVGMGGIGKTTLAKSVYEHSYIVHHFDVRLWATVSQEYSAEQILLQFLSPKNESIGVSVGESGEQLHKTLLRRRYLVVLDDMWSVEAWEALQLFLPHNSNGSSIIITTRLSTLANHLGSNSFEMKFLDENTSWKLLCKKVFGEEGCPAKLEKIGKKIAKNCKGLPLSLVVIGGHLRKSSRMKEYWEIVGNDINSILNSEDDEHCLKILYLSYTYLPAHLKPCFLYFGIYGEDEEIMVSELITLWVAEGFVKPNKVQSLEEIAEDYLRDLVDRNLILICQRNRTEEIHSCTIHDLSRELCLSVAEKEKFFCVLNNYTLGPMHIERRVVIDDDFLWVGWDPKIFHALRSAQLVRSLKCGMCVLPLELRLLRVIQKQTFKRDGACDYCEQVNLRFINTYYLADIVHLPSSISQLWNLQTLKITGVGMGVTVPSEIWEMPQLRHVELPEFFMPEPPLCSDQQYVFILKYLQTLSSVKNLSMSEEVCKRIPNIKELVVHYVGPSSYSFPHNLGRFHKLVSLVLSCPARDFALSFTFPSSLRELSLQGCFIHWKDLTMIGSLPYLELLELKINSVIGPEWNSTEGEFRSLKYLYIEWALLLRWNADSSHFPVLKRLSLYYVSELEEIPSVIGEIPTLEIIELNECRVSAAISALEILVEQESLGNESLQLRVYFFRKEKWRYFKKKLKRKGLASKNLSIVKPHHYM